MRRPLTDEANSALGTAEHDAASIPRGFTAWHQFLAQALQKTHAPGLDVHCFVKLGTLPLEADIIILQLDKDAELDEFARFFDFLVPCLRPYLILEFKSPDDRLTYADFYTVRAYAMLCKRAYEVAKDAQVAVAMMYSRVATDFFDRCAGDGYDFVETQPGVRTSSSHAMSFHTLDLVAIGKRQPENPINLLSPRRRTFGKQGHPLNLGPFHVLYEELFFRELKKMSRSHAPGSKELLQEAKRINELILSHSTPEERLRGLAPEEVFRRFSPEERLQGLAPEERLSGLSVQERARLLDLLLKPASS